MRRGVTSGLAIGLWLAFTLVAAPALAQIELDVQVVHGSNEIENASLDPECADIERRLPIKFKSLRMMERRHLNLKFGQDGRLTLPTGRHLRVVPISIVQDRLHLHFQISDRVDTRLQMRSGRPVIVGGESYDRGQLIIMLTPSFDPEPPPGPRLYRINAKD